MTVSDDDGNGIDGGDDQPGLVKKSHRRHSLL